MIDKKQRLSFTIEGRLSGLNEYTRACRTSPYVGARMKDETECHIQNMVMRDKTVRKAKIYGKVHITYKWYEQNQKRDLDNIAFAKKFIQDALVNMGVLQGDGWRHIVGFADEFYIDKNNPRVEVIISEV